MLHVLVPGRRQKCLFQYRESRGPLGTPAPCGLLLAKDKAQDKVMVLLCNGPKDFPPDVRLSLSLILTVLWEWPQRKDGE